MSTHCPLNFHRMKEDRDSAYLATMENEILDFRVQRALTMDGSNQDQEFMSNGGSDGKEARRAGATRGQCRPWEPWGLRDLFAPGTDALCVFS